MRSLKSDDGIIPTQLHATNKKVEEENLRHLVRMDNSLFEQCSGDEQ